MTTQIDAALAYAVEHDDETIKGFKEFLKIPSISSMPEHDADILRAAEWLGARLAEIEMERVEIYPTAGNPIVYGEYLKAGADAPTVLIYGHYDVQTAEPVADWNTVPFEPTILNENLYARGASDNKGDIVVTLAALEALAKTGGFPVNLKLMFEGEEEVKAKGLPEFLDEYADMLTCDFCLNVDGGMHAEGIPSINYALRGGTGFLLEITGPRQDIHSGQYGGVIENPIHVLSSLIAKLHDAEGRIAVPGIYDAVLPISDEERDLLAKNPHDEAYFMEATGVPALWGEPGLTPIERIGARPSCNVLMFQAGANKTAITARAEAIIHFRLVPDQHPDEIHRLFREFVAAQMPPTVGWTLTQRSGTTASLMPLDSPYLQTLTEVLKTVWGQAPIFGRVGGSIPAVTMLEEKLDIQTVLTGISLPDDNFHGPNEKVHLPTWRGGIEVLIRYFIALAN